MKDWLNHIEHENIDLDDCDLDDKTYFVPCYADLEPLKASILAQGIVYNPFVQLNTEEHWIPVLGRRRLLAARAIGLRRVKVGIVERHIDDSLAYEAAFWENMGHRQFDTPAKAVIVHRLLQLFPRDEVAARFLPVLGIPPYGPRLEALCRIANLEPDIHSFMASGRVNEKTALLLSHMPQKDRCACINLISRLKPNMNKTAELIGGLFDLAIYQERSVKDILDSPEIHQTLRADHTTGSAAVIEALRRLLRRLRHPELCVEETQFSEWLAGQSLPSNVTIRPSQAFEDKSCTVEIKADSKEKAAQIVRSILTSAVGD